MKNTIIAIAAMTSLSLFAIENQVTVCTQGDAQRKIEIVYPQGEETPCEVQYTKASGMQVLWKAEAQLGYCEEKAAAFIEKQRGWGWQCETLSAETTSQ
ncbi:hypothetical protein [Pleionea sp. CnH1-48]|uniref:hypothetical protein n=1 Tax=Pleionea sp. CnH1-48 TaxID=2954494 RepID=UPI0020981223|nr:hypothetical protein [Pleionea sp. CnH1-48]MCO7226735.1 hypothetical protein [Pleionea sp. CnH1-48]